MHAVLEDFFLPTKMFKSSISDYVCIVHVTIRRTDNETYTKTLLDGQ